MWETNHVDSDKGRKEYAGESGNDKLPKAGKKAAEKIVTQAGEVVCADKVESSQAEGVGYISHFATCKSRRR